MIRYQNSSEMARKLAESVRVSSLFSVFLHSTQSNRLVSLSFLFFCGEIKVFQPYNVQGNVHSFKIACYFVDV